MALGMPNHPGKIAWLPLCQLSDGEEVDTGEGIDVVLEKDPICNEITC